MNRLPLRFSSLSQRSVEIFHVNSRHPCSPYATLATENKHYPNLVVSLAGAKKKRREDSLILHGLLALLTQRPEFRRLVQQLHKGEVLPALTGITEAARPFAIAALASALQQPLLIVVDDEVQAKQMAETLKLLAEHPHTVLCLPDRDALPYERLMSDATTIQQRMNALICLTTHERNAIIICSARVLTQPVIPPQELSAALFDLRPSQEVDLTLMLEHLYNLGYEPMAEVEEPGQFSHRGGIVDLFPPTLPRPVRVEFFGDEIESLRTFDQETQRSLNPIQQCVVGPAREALPINGPTAAKQLEQLEASLLHRDAEERWKRDLEQLRNGKSF